MQFCHCVEIAVCVLSSAFSSSGQKHVGEKTDKNVVVLQHVQFWQVDDEVGPDTTVQKKIKKIFNIISPFLGLVVSSLFKSIVDKH